APLPDPPLLAGHLAGHRRGGSGVGGHRLDPQPLHGHAANLGDLPGGGRRRAGLPDWDFDRVLRLTPTQGAEARPIYPARLPSGPAKVSTGPGTAKMAVGQSLTHAAKDVGKFLAIDIETGEYAIAADEMR